MAFESERRKASEQHEDLYENNDSEILAPFLAIA